MTEISNRSILRSWVLGGLFVLFFLGCLHAQVHEPAVSPPADSAETGGSEPSQAPGPRNRPEIPEPYLMLEPGSGLTVRARSSVLIEYSTGGLEFCP